MTNAPLQTEATPHSALCDPPSESPQLAVLPPTPAPASAQTRASTPHTRNGKIARLPCVERDMVNRMLRDHVKYSEIVGALEEHGFLVTERNVSNWKTRGGYKAWRLEQDRALQDRLRQDNLLEHLRQHDAGQLPEVGLQIAATNMSQFFLDPQTQQQLATEPEKYSRPLADLCRVARHIHTLQKYRDDAAKELGRAYNPELLKRQAEEDVERTRSIYSAAKLGERPGDPLTPRRNYLPKTT